MLLMSQGSGRESVTPIHDSRPDPDYRHGANAVWRSLAVFRSVLLAPGSYLTASWATRYSISSSNTAIRHDVLAPWAASSARPMQGGRGGMEIGCASFVN